MAELTIIFWRDIPAQIIARMGRKSAKRELPQTFQEAIDQAAMRAGAKDSDAYLAAWRRGEPTTCSDDLESEVDAALHHLIELYDTPYLKRLIANGGHEAPIAPDHLVIFSPSGKRGHVAHGTSLLAAARALSVDLDSVCGGRGLCGRCQIVVQQGHDAKLGMMDESKHLSPVEAVERRYQDKRGAFETGGRLGCQARILGDVIIDVPASSQIHRQIIRKDASTIPIQIDPVVTLHFVEVKPPALEEARSDASRLRQALSEQWACDPVVIPPALFPVLQSVLRAGHWQVTVALRHRLE